MTAVGVRDNGGVLGCGASLRTYKLSKMPGPAVSAVAECSVMRERATACRAFICVRPAIAPLFPVRFARSSPAVSARFLGDLRELT